jgi:hypothetical protein
MAETDSNQYEVITTFAYSADETIVTGYVTSGAIRKGSWATFTSTEGTPVTGQVSRIGTEDAPLNLIRKGQNMPLVIGVEARHVRVGMIIRTKDDEIYAPTMLLTMMSPSQRGELAVPPQDLVDIEVLVNERNFPEASTRLDQRETDESTDHVVKRLKARILLESDEADQNVKAALALVQEAYDGKGSRDADVIETLSRALGENGDSKSGLRHLDRLYANALDVESRAYYQKKIDAYRLRFAIPDHWDVLDVLGEIIFTTNDKRALAKAYRSKRFPEGAQVRMNRIGDLVDIEEFSQSVFTTKSKDDGAIDQVLSTLSPDAGSKKKPAPPRRTPVQSRQAEPTGGINPLPIAVGAVVGCALGVIAAAVLSQAMPILGGVGLIVGLIGGFVVGRSA